MCRLFILTFSPVTIPDAFQASNSHCCSFALYLALQMQCCPVSFIAFLRKVRGLTMDEF